LKPLVRARGVDKCSQTGPRRGRDIVPEPIITTGAATLAVVRPKAWVWKLVPFEVVVDGQVRGNVANDDFTVIECSPGRHEVNVKVPHMKLSKQPVTIDLPAGGRAEIVCHVRDGSNPFTRYNEKLFVASAAFALLAGFVPTTKAILAPYQDYWGPVFIGTMGVIAVGGFMKMKATGFKGGILELSQREPSLTPLDLRNKAINEIRKPGR
jgi:hypothetical protein